MSRYKVRERVRATDPKTNQIWRGRAIQYVDEPALLIEVEGEKILVPASWALVESGIRKGVQLTFRDQGPGIPDLDLAMTDGWTSGGGLGLGLSGSRRLVDDFVLDTTPGQGTRITITKWK